MKSKGFSLIETVLYIGLLAILLPSFVMVTLGYIQKSESVDPKIRMEEKAAVLFSEIQYELNQAQSIDVTGSSLATDDSSLVFVDAEGASVTLSRTADAIAFIGGDQTIDRLERETASNVQWITDSDIDVNVWNVAVVRDSAGTLTGLNISMTMSVLNADGSPYRDISFSTDTTISLQPYTTEL